MPKNNSVIPQHRYRLICESGNQGDNPTRSPTLILKSFDKASWLKGLYYGQENQLQSQTSFTTLIPKSFDNASMVGMSILLVGKQQEHQTPFTNLF